MTTPLNQLPSPNGIQEYKETQRLLDEGVVGYLPEKISNRMLKRLVRVLFVLIVGLLFGW